MISTTDLIKQAESLSIEDLTKVIDSLNSLLHKTDPEIERAWLDVAEDRLKAVEEGNSKLVSGDVVFKRANDILGR